MLGLNFSVIRFLSQAERPRQLINSSFTLTGLLSLLAAGIFLAGLHWWSPALTFVRQNNLFTLTFLAVVVLATATSLTDSIFVAKRRAGFVLLFSTIASLLKLAFVVVLSLASYAFGIVTSWTIALAIAVVISLFLFLPRVESSYRPVPNLSLGQVKGLARYSIHSYVASLLSRGPTMVLPILVLNTLGAESNAHFYVAWRIAELLFAIPWAVSQSLFAEGSFSPHRLKENVTRSIKFSLILLVGGTVIFIVAAKWLLLAFGQSYSSNALHLLWLLSLAGLPQGISHVYIAVLRVRDRLKELVIVRGFVAMAAPALSLLAMPRYGIIGVGWVWLGVQAVVVIVSVIRLRTLVSSFGSHGD
jgi:O-antigen/teichoic acid export membrane protein